MNGNPRLVLFEDDDDDREHLVAQLASAFGSEDVVIEGFRPENGPVSPEEPFEDWAVRQLSEIGNVQFVVADRDLTRYGGGFSEAAVTAACRRMAIPVCRYARKRTDASEELLEGHLGPEHLFVINVDANSGWNRLAASVRALYSGFQSIGHAVPDLTSDVRALGPARSLAEILGQPHLYSDLALYSVDPSTAFRQVLAGDSNGGREDRRLAFFLGFWLFNSVLRYPGVILNSVATGSYLGVSTEDLQREDVSSVLETAVYDGPFASTDAYWWRFALDRLLLDADVEDGIALCASRGVTDVSPAMCSVCGKSPAGYYCVITRAVVSHECSVGGLGWIPKGADLCRVARPKYDELAPWLNW